MHNGRRGNESVGAVAVETIKFNRQQGDFAGYREFSDAG